MDSVSIETSGGKASLVAFSVLQIIGGQIGMIFIMFTAFTSSERVRRHPCFLNFALSWFLYSLSYTLLLYGGELYNPNPAHGLCVAQTAFTYGTAPMASMASFMFVLQYARRHPDDIQRLHFYCHISNNTFGNVPPALAAVGIIGALVVLVLLGVKVFYNWRSFRRLDNASHDLTTGLIARALIFTCFSIIAVLLCAVLISTKDGNMVASGIFLALLPVVVFIVFGIQRDLGRLIYVPSKKTESSGIQVQLEVTVTQTVSKSSSL